MGLKKIFAVAAICLALLLDTGSLVEASRSSAGAFGSDGARRVATGQRRAVRRRASKSMSKRTKGEPVQEGEWGGAHVRLSVREGGAEVEFDCAHGMIDRRIELDAEGRFDVGGTFVPEGGPVSVSVNGDVQQKSLSVRYRGRVEGRKMTLNVTVAETGAAFDALTLTHGGVPRLEKCY